MTGARRWLRIGAWPDVTGRRVASVATEMSARMRTSKSRGHSFRVGVALVMAVYALIPVLMIPVTIATGTEDWEDLEFVAGTVSLIVLATVVLAALAVLATFLTRNSSESVRGIANGLLVGIGPGFIVGILGTVAIATLWAW